MRKQYGFNTELDRAVADFGGQAQVARALGVSQGLVGQWVHGTTRITAERALQLVRIFGGAVSPDKLCPTADWEALRLSGGVGRTKH